MDPCRRIPTIPDRPTHQTRAPYNIPRRKNPRQARLETRIIHLHGAPPRHLQRLLPHNCGSGSGSKPSALITRSACSEKMASPQPPPPIAAQKHPAAPAACTRPAPQSHDCPPGTPPARTATQPHALLLRVLHFPAGPRHVRLVRRYRQLTGRRPLPDARAHAIHRRVATANHHHMLAGRVQKPLSKSGTSSPSPFRLDAIRKSKDGTIPGSPAARPANVARLVNARPAARHHAARAAQRTSHPVPLRCAGGTQCRLPPAAASGAPRCPFPA